jgi:hypothetical protein
VGDYWNMVAAAPTGSTPVRFLHPAGELMNKVVRSQPVTKNGVRDVETKPVCE